MFSIGGKVQGRQIGRTRFGIILLFLSVFALYPSSTGDLAVPNSPACITYAHIILACRRYSILAPSNYCCNMDRCGRIIGHITLHRMVGCILSGSSTVTVGVSCELLRYEREVHGRWHGTSPCDNERTIALWTNALRAYEGKSSELIPPGPRSREAVQFNGIE